MSISGYSRLIKVISFSNNVLIIEINAKIIRVNLKCTIININDEPKEFPGYPLNKTSLFGIIILTSCAAFTLLLCLGWIGVLYYRQFRRHRRKTKLQQTLANSVQQILDKTPITLYSATSKMCDAMDDDPMCAICLETFIDNDKIRQLGKFRKIYNAKLEKLDSSLFCSKRVCIIFILRALIHGYWLIKTAHYVIEIF